MDWVIINFKKLNTFLTEFFLERTEYRFKISKFENRNVKNPITLQKSNYFPFLYLFWLPIAAWRWTILFQKTWRQESTFGAPNMDPKKPIQKQRWRSWGLRWRKWPRRFFTTERPCGTSSIPLWLPLSRHKDPFCLSSRTQQRMQFQTQVITL